MAPGRHRVDPDNPDQGYHAPFYGAQSKLFAASDRHALNEPPQLGTAGYEQALRQVRGKGIKPELMGTVAAASRRSVERDPDRRLLGLRRRRRPRHAAAALQPDHPRSGAKYRQPRQCRQGEHNGAERPAIRAGERGHGRRRHPRLGAEVSLGLLAPGPGHSRTRWLHGAGGRGGRPDRARLPAGLAAPRGSGDERAVQTVERAWAGLPARPCPRRRRQELHPAVPRLSLRARHLRRRRLPHHPPLLRDRRRRPVGRPAVRRPRVRLRRAQRDQQGQQRHHTAEAHPQASPTASGR